MEGTTVHKTIQFDANWLEAHLSSCFLFYKMRKVDSSISQVPPNFKSLILLQDGDMIDWATRVTTSAPVDLGKLICLFGETFLTSVH